MPIYEYACKSCRHSFDVLQKMGAAALVSCPECGELELQKLLSAPNFRLKGSGWYETDFKKDNQRNLAGDTSDGSKKNQESKKDGKDNQPAGTGQSKSTKSGADATAKPGSSGTKAD